MQCVWKFTLEVNDGWQCVMMPEDARVLYVAAPAGRPVVSLWALVDPEAEPASRFFAVAGTGHPVPEIPNRPAVAEYRGTAMMLGGDLVWHVFEAAAATGRQEDGA